MNKGDYAQIMFWDREFLFKLSQTLFWEKTQNRYWLEE